jgi:hypothetical protein
MAAAGARLRRLAGDGLREQALEPAERLGHRSADGAKTGLAPNERENG